MELEIKKLDLEGYMGPYKLLDYPDCLNILNEKYIPKKLYAWQKSIHEKSAVVTNLASHPLILEKLRKVLGNNILLWGSIFIQQKPNNEHPWHLDVEYGSCKGLTLWIGLKNLSEKTSISLITHSHNIDTAPQELKKNDNIDIENDNAVLESAKKFNPNCELKTFYLSPGEFIIWSGRTWHKTSNTSKKARETILLQYCSTDNIVKIPANYEYPNTEWSDKKPPCILVSGVDKINKNIILDKSKILLSNNFINKIKINIIYKIRFKLSSFLRSIVTKKIN
jgi:ectoine hydroxylase-related dioxygenase (phytanoyl-CoA dioxygenase family)